MMSIQSLKEFLTELELSKGKDNVIFVALAGSSKWIEREVEKNGFEILRVALSKDDSLFKLVDTLLKWRDTGENAVYFVYGMSNQFPEILSYLNLHRDFLYDVKRPVIVIGSEYEIVEIATNAPDLWRFRNRTFDFLEREPEIEVELAEEEEEEEAAAVEFISEPIFSAAFPSSTYKWGEEEIRERIELNEHLLEIINDEYRKSEIDKTLAVYYLRLEEYEKSEKCFNEFLKLREGDEKRISLGYSLRALAFGELKQYEKALENYNKAIELNPNDADTCENRGLTYVEMGKYEEAAKDFKTAGILFYNQGSENCIKNFSICFDLRDKVKGKSEEVFFCGLTLYLLTTDEKILEELKALQIDGESLRRLLEFSLRKSKGEKLSGEVRKELEKEEREEIKLLLELLLK